ncbi:MAG: hypothetical protein QM769_11170 [Pseudoxanthomonas sp.]
MLGIPLGLLYANAGEWVIHKYVLHGVGKKKKSFWNFHWGEHHRASRKNDFRDPDYERSVFGKHAQGKEALGIAGLMLVHAPLFPVAPYFTATVWYSACKLLHHASQGAPRSGMGQAASSGITTIITWAPIRTPTGA